MEYTLRKAINRYKKYTKADCYYLDFFYKHNLYSYQVEELPRKNLFMKVEGKKLGNKQSLSLSITNKDKEEWIANGAILLGSEELILNAKNKGVACEDLHYELANQKPKGKDNFPFYKGGDIEINGKQIQIKFINNLVRVCYSDTLYRLEKKIIF